MFDRLEDLVLRLEEVLNQLSEPDVASDPDRFRRLMKEQSDLTPIVEAYKAYKQNQQNIEESLMILDEESDEEMRELANPIDLRQHGGFVLVQRPPEDQVVAGVVHAEHAAGTVQVFHQEHKDGSLSRGAGESLGRNIPEGGGYREA